MGSNPFLVETNKPLVALCGVRKGYILLATREVIESYADWQDSVFNAAKAWSAAAAGGALQQPLATVPVVDGAR